MKKEKIPSVATSKENKKQQGNMNEKAKKKLLVLKDKSKKQRKKKALHKVSSETEDKEEEWVESGDSLDDVSLLGSSDNDLQNIEKGDYVI
ncbi:hypothetical protein PR048_013574, partial [Dryococelus australis]